MWATLLLCSIVGQTAADYGWIPGQHYVYNLTAINFAALHQVANQISGIHIKGELHIHVDSDQQLTLQVKNTKYVDVNQRLNENWETFTPEAQNSYKNFPLTTAIFQLKINKGLVEKIVVPKDTPYWQRNWYKGIATQFQIDTQAQNLKASISNDVPHDDQNTGVFSTMEESIHGKYKTNYDISVLPKRYHEYQNDLESISESVNLKNDDSKYYQIVKTKNFSNSDVDVVYRYGLNGHEGWEEGTNTMGNILTRTSHSKIELFGNLKEYTILSTQTTDKILGGVHLYSSQKGSVVSRLTLILKSIKKLKGPSPSIQNTESLESLIYEHGRSQKDEIEEELPRISSNSSVASNAVRSSEGYPSSQNPLNGTLTFDYDRLQEKSEKFAQSIVKVARQIGNSLNNPSDIPKNSVLNWFVALKYMGQVASLQQLQQATEKLYYSEILNADNQEGKETYRSWQAFRDAVAEAGTGPALVTISSWIKTGKVRGNEAAQVLSVLPRAARYPTTEYVAYYFELVKSKEVQGQKYLNDSAILSFSDLLRRSHGEGKRAQHHYPIKMSGTQSQNDRAVVEEYIPYFQRQLKDAIAQGDSPKIQLYIRAIANIAHRKILAVFEPYLEGKEPVSTFQRFLMIACLDDFTKVHPNTARSVLYSIYQNLGEAPEIRVAAVMQLMKTNPSAQMLQRMAEQTNYDHSKQVNAAVKSAIESAASGEYHTDPQLIQNAKSATNFLSAENYGLQYSKNYFYSYAINEQMSIQNKHHLSFIQGLHGLYPDAFIHSLQQNVGGYLKEPYTISYFSSGTQQLVNAVLQQLAQNYQPQGTRQPVQSQESQHSDYSYMREVLNWEDDEPLQVEGNAWISLLGGKRFFAFDNSTVEQLPEVFRQVNEKLRKGVNYEESKFYYRDSIEIEFPLVTGARFTYSYHEPSLAYVGVQGKGRLYQFQETDPSSRDYWFPLSAGLIGEHKFVLSVQRRCDMEIFVPSTGRRYFAGVEKNAQLYVPLKGKVEVNGYNNSFKASLQPFTDSTDVKLYQHKTDIYTAYKDIDLKPDSESSIEYIHVGPKETHQRSFGQKQTGYTFRIDVNSTNNFLNLENFYNSIYRNGYDIYSHILDYCADKTIADDYFAISYEPQSSSHQDTVISVSYDSQRQEEQKLNGGILKGQLKHGKEKSKKIRNMAQPSSVSSRKEDLWRNVKTDIEDAQIHLFDASISFGGSQEDGKYVLTFAHSDSPVSEKSRFLIFYSGIPLQEPKDGLQFAAQINVKWPQLSFENYKDALEAKANAYIDGEIKFNGSDETKSAFQGKMRRSKKREKYLRNHPLAFVCDQQMNLGNYYHQSCLNMTQNVNYLDNYDFYFDYQYVPEVIKNLAQKMYGAARHVWYNNNDESIVGVSHQKGKINVGIQFTENLQKANISIKNPTLESYFVNIHGLEWVQPLLVQHLRYSQMDLLAQKVVYSENYPICSLDANRASTFNNKSYTVNFGDCYYTLAISASEHDYYTRNFAILVKDVGGQKRNVQVLLGNDIVFLESSGANGVSVKTNGENLLISENTIAKWSNGTNEVQAYSLPRSNNVVLYSRSHGIQLIYDGQRVQLSISNHYRNRVRGLCGTFDGEPENDFTVPGNCILKNVQDFTASYVIADKSCIGPAKDLYLQAKNAPCYPKETVFTDVVSDAEAGRQSIRKTGSSMPFVMAKKSCSSFRVMTVDDGERKCFSIRPQLHCSCKAASKIEKTIDFVCLPDSVATRHWLGMVKDGLSPDFSHIKANHQQTVTLPEICIEYNTV